MKKYIISILLVLTSSLYSKTIIWDLGDTLFKTSRLGIAHDIGFWYFLKYLFFEWKSPNIQPIVFDILNKIDPSDEYPHDKALDAQGRPLPIVMHKWLQGAITSQELLVSIKSYLESPEMKQYFSSPYQKNLVEKTLQALFTPEVLARNTYPIIQGIKLLQECYLATTSDGKQKNRLMILSNWDTVSFSLLKNRFPEIFKLFQEEHILISAALGLIKPHRAAFEYVLKTYFLDPIDVIFIDDQYTNVAAAQACGITGILIEKQNYRLLRRELQRLCVI
jgi:putative hydrolase of the HAD superfamily